MRRSFMMFILVTILVAGSTTPAWSQSSLGANIGVNPSTASGDGCGRKRDDQAWNDHEEKQFEDYRSSTSSLPGTA